MKTMVKFNLILGLALTLAFASSCESNKFEDQQMTHVANSMLLTQVLANQPCTPTATSPSFTSISADIAAAGCTAQFCHNNTDRAAQLDLTAYNEVVLRVTKGQPAQSLLYNKISPGGSMEQRILTNKAGFQKLVYDWIQGCALP